jgi:hypothetical protein
MEVRTQFITNDAIISMGVTPDGKIDIQTEHEVIEFSLEDIERFKHCIDRCVDDARSRHIRKRFWGLL